MLMVWYCCGMEGDVGYVKILRDLTDRKKSEGCNQKYVKELEDLNAHKENVLAIVSHDLKSPFWDNWYCRIFKSQFKSTEPHVVKRNA
jgi:hypothetical protein